MGISSIVGKRQSFPDFLWSTGSWKDMVAVTRHPSVFISLSGAGKRQDWWNRKQESIAGL